MKTKLFKRLFRLGLLFTAACLLLIGAANILIRSASKGRLYADVQDIPHRPAALVLGCSRQLANGSPNLFFIKRVDAAARLFHAGKVDYLLVSGDNRFTHYDEATDMKNALVDLGVPADRVACDYAGLRTLDSVVRAKAVFGQTNITVVSQRFHNQRALYIAQRHGIDAIGFNAGEVVFRHSFKTKLREQFARVKTVLDIWFGKRPRHLGAPVDITAQE